MGPNKTFPRDSDLNDVATFAPSSGMYQFSVIENDIVNKPSGAGSTNYAINYSESKNMVGNQPAVMRTNLLLIQ